MVTNRRIWFSWCLAGCLSCVGLAVVIASQAADSGSGDVSLIGPQGATAEAKPDNLPLAVPAEAPDAKETPPPPKAAAEEVALRGPLHEAFATQINLDPAASPIIDKPVPKPIDELPPESRPEGASIQWIAGYWAWDEGAKDYIWISGVRRNVPPGRQWVPGYWAEAEGGSRWHSGAWVDAAKTEVQYLPAPQPSLERGPTVEAPSPSHIWVPGCWVYQGLDYRWRPGYWLVARPGWVWMPDHYVWTPRGVIFVPGYWDYELVERGTPFCPVVFHGTPYLVVGYHYRPSVVIATDLLLVHLFVHPTHHHYYFGDYYHVDFVHVGIHPWYDMHAYHHGFDPLFTYYRWDHARHGVDLEARLHGWHEYYAGRPDLRPRHVFVAGPHAVGPVHGPLDHGHPPMLGTPLHQMATAPSKARFVSVNAEELKAARSSAVAAKGLGEQRRGLEVSKGPAGSLLASGQGKAVANHVSTLKLPASAPQVRAATAKTTDPKSITSSRVSPTASNTGHAAAGSHVSTTAGNLGQTAAGHVQGAANSSSLPGSAARHVPQPPKCAASSPPRVGQVTE